MEIEAYLPKLRIWATIYTQDKEEREDLVQDTILKALNFKREPRNIEGVLFITMKNIFLDDVKENKVAKDNVETVASDMRKVESPEYIYRQKELGERIECLNPPIVSLVTKMYIMEGCTFQEIGDKLGIHRSRAWRVFQKGRNALTNEGERNEQNQ